MTTFINTVIARPRLVTLALIAFALLAVGQAGAPAAQAASAQQWRFGAPAGGAVYSHTAYTLRNDIKGGFLLYQDRNGIDLGWRSTSAPEWTVGRSWDCGRRTCTIYHNRRVALRNEAIGRFLKYGSTGSTGGINLVWSDTAVYEWSIRALDANGDLLTSNDPVTGAQVAFFNHTSGKYVVQGAREPYEAGAVDLVWASTL